MFNQKIPISLRPVAMKINQILVCLIAHFSILLDEMRRKPEQTRPAEFAYYGGCLAVKKPTMHGANLVCLDVDDVDRLREIIKLGGGHG